GRGRDRVARVSVGAGRGMSGLGRSKRQASVAADLAESAIPTITDAEAIGRFESISEWDAFEMEYWPLQQAKLGSEPQTPLAGQVAVITGAGGVIGAATGRALAGAGAEGARRR